MQQRTALGEKFGPPLKVALLGPRFLRAAGVHIPLVGPTVDRLLVGDDQLQPWIGQCLFGLGDGDTVDDRLGQPDLGLVQLVELPVRHAACVGEIRSDEREFDRIEHGD